MRPLVWACVDGNEAAARVAYACSETIAIYPITPASPMAEAADVWAVSDRPNLWGGRPRVIEMQSEAGAAGALHGAVTKGSLGTTFTASQGLLLMLPNLYKIAGELAPAVIHVAARSVATHALSIFGDHSDVMAARATGVAMLASASVQEAHDLAAVAHAATLMTRVPFLHFFDGFRTSHELGRIELLDDDTLRALMDDDAISAHRSRGLSPERPMIRGTAQNPDVFFQAREAANPFYDDVAPTVQSLMDQFGALTGRHYRLAEYHGAPDATRVVVLMGSGVGAVTETVDELVRRGEKVGLIQVRLYRPFPSEHVLAALPATVERLAVLDRTKEPGAVGEPLYQDVASALMQGVATGRMRPADVPIVEGGRYGLASKEFTPAMIKGVFDHLRSEPPRPGFTVGIVDDVTGRSLRADPDFVLTPSPGSFEAVFWGLGSDGTVGASKNTVKIVGEHTDLFAQGYSQYDSKKSGAVTVSHVRISPTPIRSTYLIDTADLVACHQFGFLQRQDVLARARRGAIFLLNAPFGPREVWDRLPTGVQRTIIDRELRLYVIDAYRVAREVGLGARINTVMQPCFFALSGILPGDQAMAAVKEAVRRSYGKRGPDVVDRNLAAVDRALQELHAVDIPDRVTASSGLRPPVPAHAPEFVQRVTGPLLAGEGDRLPVSALPVDGTFPTGTSKWEKRAIAQDVPVWDPSLCIDCGKCVIVCPHAAIRMKAFDPEALDGAPDGFPSKEFGSRQLPGKRLTVQVAPDDCTGCAVCVDVCPAVDKIRPEHRALDMEPVTAVRDRELVNAAFFETLPETDRSTIPHDDVKHSQLLAPLFEFSGACAGCGETPYLKLLTQLFGDRTIIANATGCSSIFGGNLPTTPWTTDVAGRGPAWSNSLFEDNAEFGLGIRVAADQQADAAARMLARLSHDVGSELVAAILEADQHDEPGIAAQRGRVAELKRRLKGLNGSRRGTARRLLDLADALVRQSIWIVGGDGWAYDIGFGGLDHVLAAGLDVNVLVLDTEVYSNTGGQASKATARGAVAKFATAGKDTRKKDLGLLAMQYGGVYVAQIALGANEHHTIRAFHEAEAHRGPSLILAYATCVEHGVDMRRSMSHMKEAVRSGYWPLFRYDPEHPDARPFQLDSRPPTVALADFLGDEGRYTMVERRDPERAKHLLALAEDDVRERWHHYEQLASLQRLAPQDGPDPSQGGRSTPAGGTAT